MRPYKPLAVAAAAGLLGAAYLVSREPEHSPLPERVESHSMADYPAHALPAKRRALNQPLRPSDAGLGEHPPEPQGLYQDSEPEEHVLTGEAATIMALATLRRAHAIGAPLSDNEKPLYIVSIFQLSPDTREKDIFREIDEELVDPYLDYLEQELSSFGAYRETIRDSTLSITREYREECSRLWALFREGNEQRGEVERKNREEQFNQGLRELIARLMGERNRCFKDCLDWNQYVDYRELFYGERALKPWRVPGDVTPLTARKTRRASRGIAIRKGGL